MRLAAYVPMLLDRFPDAAFTPASLEHVAAKAVKGFPTYGELASWLADWWRDHRPMPTAIAGPAKEAPPPEPRVPPTPEETAYVRRCVQEIVGNMRSPQAEPDEPALRKPAYLSPAQLDVINPLPGGVKRVRQSVQ